MVHVEAVPGPLALSHPRQRPVEAVSKPVQRQKENAPQQSLAMPPREGVTHSCKTLSEKPQRGKVIRVDPLGCARGHPEQDLFLRFRNYALLNPECVRKAPLLRPCL